jgi:glycosyltransferase involved in cell wall biosynthesis
LRVAIVHHWFVTRGGGERVAECLASLFPDAPIFTLLKLPEGIPDGLRDRTFQTSFLQKLPWVARHHRHMMPLYAAATESLDLRGFDLVISSDSGPVKGVRLDPGAIQICYCHSPMRYLYDGFAGYSTQMNGLVRAAFRLSAGRLRRWDQKAADRVTYFIANSHYVAERIQRIYGRTSEVIYPPIDLSLARSVAEPGKHYLCAGRLVAYKQTSLLIEACERLGRSLRIVGTGPEEPGLRRIASRNIQFLGHLADDALWQEYAQCRALLFAADEDFGMVPLEAQACGRPVICFGAGGSLETVRNGETGVYFAEQTVESVMDGILRFEAAENSFTSETTQRWAQQFSTPVFLNLIRNFILQHVPVAAVSAGLARTAE